MTIKKKPATTDFVILWEFLVRSGRRREFERLYGSNGLWANFFRSSEGYVRTELIRDLRTPRRYLTIDVWRSREAYSQFKKENRVQYRVIDQECSSLTEGEVKIGEFLRGR